MALKRKYIVVKVFRALYLTALSVVLLLGLALVLLQNPGVQTWLSGEIVEKVFSRIDGDIRYEKIHLKPFNTIVIKNLAIKDKHPYLPPPEVLEQLEDFKGPQDTLFAAEYVIVRLSIWETIPARVQTVHGRKGVSVRRGHARKGSVQWDGLQSAGISPDGGTTGHGIPGGRKSLQEMPLEWDDDPAFHPRCGTDEKKCPPQSAL